MRRTLEGAEVGSRAQTQARKAAAAAGVEVSTVEDLDGIRAISKLFDHVWGTPEDESLLAPGMLRALTHAGNYAAGGFVDGEMVGAVVGFLGSDEDGVFLHSHILGVSDEHRGGNVGFALKQHQRAWALEHGMHKVTWTFDPLVRRNAFFNVQKLGADAATYLEKFYGSMSDDINAGDETDRLLIVWHLDVPRVERAAADRLDEPNVTRLLSDGATVALSESGDVAASGWGDVVVCATPPDIVELRHRDAATALSWRRALRNTLGVALGDGYAVTGFTRSGWYVLERA